MSDVKPGKGRFKVVGACAVVRVLDGSERYLYKNAVFDAAAADAESVKHLVAVGLVAKVADRPSAAEAAAAKAAADAKAKADAEAKAKAEAEAAEKAKADAAAKAAAAK